MKAVHVIASSPVIQTGLEAVIGTNPSLELAASEDAADVVVIECESGTDERARVAPHIEPDAGAPALVVLTNDQRAPWLIDALRLNVRAILARNAAPDAIACAIEAAASGLIVLERSAIDALAPLSASTRSGVALRTGDSTLTPREAEVLRMLAEGVGNKVIAARLSISEHTVKFHVASIFSKLGAQSRTEAVTLGARQGLIML